LKKCFWKSVYEKLHQQLQDSAADSELRAGWSVQVREESRKSDPEVYICSAKSSTLQLGVFQEKRKLYYGIRFCFLQQRRLPAAVHDLRKLLPAEWDGPDDWRLGSHDNTRYGIGRGGEFLLKVAENATGVSQPMTDAITRVLRDHPREVIDANPALANNSRP
jgi:hypothetical protein